VQNKKKKDQSEIKSSGDQITKKKMKRFMSYKSLTLSLPKYLTSERENIIHHLLPSHFSKTLTNNPNHYRKE
jgi:hypothetical protein